MRDTATGAVTNRQNEKVYCIIVMINNDNPKKRSSVTKDAMDFLNEVWRVNINGKLRIEITKYFIIQYSLFSTLLSSLYSTNDNRFMYHYFTTTPLAPSVQI